jgi:hypothetical protein
MRDSFSPKERKKVRGVRECSSGPDPGRLDWELDSHAA